MGAVPGSGLTFFFDRSCGRAVPEALRIVRLSVAIHDDEGYPQTAPDEQWIAGETRKDRILVVCDKRIRKRPAERAAYRRHKARVFVLGGNSTRFYMLRDFMAAWDQMLSIVRTQAAPFVATIHSGGRVHLLEPRR